VNKWKRKLKETVEKVKKAVGKKIRSKRKLKETVEKVKKAVGKKIEIVIFFEGKENRTVGKLIKIDPDLGIVIEIHEKGMSILPLQLLQDLIREIKLDGKIIFFQE